ncbi:hypothetical protein BDA96_10G228700 [Sorghum bicolor]|uniref:Uncharacterized protein n=2 Tax=Sorghum bicolor TaxID=4558 RepID=A0A921Q3B9_SORBI|nr:hypothetical protein BDA96_10G228700 [Sorghum bicolor]KXG20231.1 hypothetical protein SORBI_3010G173500 [Sorghum bicolor]
MDMLRLDHLSLLGISLAVGFFLCCHRHGLLVNSCAISWKWDLRSLYDLDTNTMLIYLACTVLLIASVLSLFEY